MNRTLGRGCHLFWQAQSDILDPYLSFRRAPQINSHLSDNALRVYHLSLVLAREKNSYMSKATAIQPQQGVRPLGKIEVLPNAIHTIAMHATSECYGVVGLTSPRLHNERAVL